MTLHFVNCSNEYHLSAHDFPIVQTITSKTQQVIFFIQNMFSQIKTINKIIHDVFNFKSSIYTFNKLSEFNY